MTNNHWEKATPSQIEWADKKGCWVAAEEDEDEVCRGCAFLDMSSCDDFPCGDNHQPRVIFRRKTKH